MTRTNTNKTYVKYISAYFQSEGLEVDSEISGYWDYGEQLCGVLVKSLHLKII